ncbi:hypothetical protein J6590_010302 [Homalodisca vitripennis]|nr:hypothetical protein J6590_010302 [Homalodisca vitripennis]
MEAARYGSADDRTLPLGTISLLHSLPGRQTQININVLFEETPNETTSDRLFYKRKTPVYAHATECVIPEEIKGPNELNTEHRNRYLQVRPKRGRRIVSYGNSVKCPQAQVGSEVSRPYVIWELPTSS